MQHLLRLPATTTHNSELFWNKFHRQRIDAMSRIFFGQMFALKHMTQMAVAVCAGNFGAGPIGIRCALHSTRNFLIKTWPAAAGMEFSIRGIQCGITAPTNICTLFIKVIVLTGKRTLRSFMDNDCLLFGSEIVMGHRFSIEC